MTQKYYCIFSPYRICFIVTILFSFFILFTNSSTIKCTNISFSAFADPFTDGTTMEPSTISLQTVDDLLTSNVKEGDIVSTSGFYKANDGGGAIYRITSSNAPADNMFSFKLKNGLSANLQPSGNNIIVDQLGAKADGHSDDAPYLQAALNSGYNVSLSENKSYRLISNGLVINRNLNFDGKNSTITVGNDYAPISSEFEKRIIRTDNLSHDLVQLNNLNIRVEITDSMRYSGDNYLCVIQPTFINNVELNNFNIYITESQNSITAFWMDFGCNKLLLNNCTFVNNTTFKEGGILFFNSRNDTKYNNYNAFKNIHIKDCNFTGTCGDEVLAIWGPNDINAAIENSSFILNRAYTGNSSRLINISNTENTNTTYNVKFIGCTFQCSSVNNQHCDSLVGIGTLYPSTKINTRFANCNINANVKDCLVHFAVLPTKPDYITKFSRINDHYTIQFHGCDITCNKTLVGSNSSYDPTSGANWAIDCSFTNSKIKCNHCAVFLQYYTTTKYYYEPRLEFINNIITIENYIGTIYKTTNSATADIKYENNTVNGKKNTPSVVLRYNATPTGAISQT